MAITLRTVLACLLLSLPGVATASSWCLVFDAEEECRFITADACYKASNEVGGYCKPSPYGLGMSGIAPYCVITDTERRCTYYDQQQCLARAVEEGGGCVPNTELDQARRAKELEEQLGCIPRLMDC